VEAADAFAHDRERDAARILRPLRDAMPESPSVRELLGLSLYRMGRYADAAKELEVFASLTGEVTQHPVLMDCARALNKPAEVDRLWRELGEASPSAELVTEGRIVYAGMLADRGDLDGALALLRRRAGDVRRARPHHLRLWYALGDLEDRAGNLAEARVLFQRVARQDPAFADVAERLVALG
jgi:tetratricopeptide (TPR) repeat protein